MRNTVMCGCKRDWNKMSYYPSELLDLSFKESVTKFVLDNGHWVGGLEDIDLDLSKKFKQHKPDLEHMYKELENINLSLQEYNPLQFNAHRVDQLTSQQRKWIKEHFLKQCKAEWEVYALYVKETNAKRAVLKSKALARESEINSWVPPTSKHEKIKEEIKDGLRVILDFKVNEMKTEKRQSVYVWWSQEVLSLQVARNRHIEMINDTINAVNETNEWVIALRNSLK
jgi:hypothetical protein